MQHWKSLKETRAKRQEVAEVCISEEFNASCPTDKIILVNLAEFGRMEVGRCIRKPDEFLGCANDVLPLLDNLCSGRQEFESRCNPDKPNVISSKNGYISSIMLHKKGCGSSKSLWIISASPGQTIQLDLIDFSANQQDNNLISCGSVYGFIIERSLGINHTICGGWNRERALYTSKTNSVEIQLLITNRRKEVHFLLRYSAAIVKKDVTNRDAFHISTIVVISAIAGGAVVLSVIAVVCGVVYINKYRMKQEMKRANLYKTYSTIGSNVQAYYRPVNVDQSENNATCWDMSLVPPNQMTLLSDKCTCPTLQMRNQGNGDKTEGERSVERQSLYSSIKST
ncbi:hypothetical protein LSH36_1487g00027 [Paralvinella palmiformis]|uniref:CUB domain-containing protein n=1 Tax=Paralvinella palmiformis TaxID=53620 RepID=A0AAD9IT19_9ANNE|nr:hypothetical protein LSH36_1487g00027 [Paralvinella palmiformis]